MEITIQELEKEFVGNGEAKNSNFKQIAKSEFAYIYEREKHGQITFEVFERKNSPICIDFDARLYSDTEFKETYPKGEVFGRLAWYCGTKEKAFYYFNEINTKQCSK